MKFLNFLNKKSLHFETWDEIYCCIIKKGLYYTKSFFSAFLVWMLFLNKEWYFSFGRINFNFGNFSWAISILLNCHWSHSKTVKNLLSDGWKKIILLYSYFDKEKVCMEVFHWQNSCKNSLNKGFTKQK